MGQLFSYELYVEIVELGFHLRELSSNVFNPFSDLGLVLRSRSGTGKLQRFEHLPNRLISPISSTLRSWRVLSIVRPSKSVALPIHFPCILLPAFLSTCFSLAT